MAREKMHRFAKIQALRFPNIEDLELVLASIDQPYSLETMYWDGTNHVAWITPALRRVEVERERKVTKNGNSSSKRQN